MTLEEANKTVAAYAYFNSVVAALEASSTEDPILMIGIGMILDLYPYPKASAYIDRDLVQRMLQHALARAKAKVDALGDNSN